MSRDHRSRSWRAVLAGTGAVALVTGLMITPTVQAATSHAVAGLSGNLVVNGDAESGTTGWELGTGPNGWTGTIRTEAYGDGGVAFPALPQYVNNLGTVTGALGDAGTSYFVGPDLTGVTPFSSGWSYVYRQDIDFTAAAAAAGKDRLKAFMAADVGGYLSSNDRVQVTFTWLNALGNETTSAPALAAATNANRGNTTGYIHRENPLWTVPATARGVRIELRFITTAADEVTGFVDNVEFRISADNPPAVDLVSPADGAAYQVGDVVPVSFSCGATAVTCVGTQADGSTLDTSTPGTYTFEVVATDEDDVTTTETITYTVADVVGTPAIHPAAVAGLLGVIAVGGALLIVRRRFSIG